MTSNLEKSIHEARFHKLFDDTQSMSIQGYRADGSVVYWNAASERIYGYSHAEAYGQKIYDLIIPEEMCDEVAKAVAWMFAHEQGMPAERLNLKHKDGSTVPVYSSHTVVSLPNDEPIMFCMDADMRELEVAEAEVQRLSYYDSLTGLPNRHLMLERIASVMHQETNNDLYGALLIVDIDSFHAINDSLGYSIGDQVLVSLANILKGFNASAENIARLGKDEFALFLPYITHSLNTAAIEARHVARRVMNMLEQPLTIAGQSHHVSACIGITLFHYPNSLSSDELLRQASIALKMAKESGTTSINFFDQEMELAVKERLQISQALIYAIENDELTLVFQPQVNTQHQTIGYETLLRWQHAELGAIPPSTFIPIAEATGSIIHIGDWVLEQSCRTLVQWSKQKEKQHLRVSVNVSPVQFRSLNFVARVKRIIENTGVCASKLRFELTENMIADDIDFIVKQMTMLRELGVSISLDDFGTGYASLAYLTRLPLDELKIDRAFISKLGQQTEEAFITETIISLGQSMNLVVIAEGIETEQQLQRLKSMGCEYFQGYLFGKPQAISS